MEAMNFQDDIPWNPNDNFKDLYELVFDLTSMQDAIENCQYTELVGEPLRLEPNFNLPLENVTELNVVGERMSSLQLTSLMLLQKKTSKMDNISLH